MGQIFFLPNKFSKDKCSWLNDGSKDMASCSLEAVNATLFIKGVKDLEMGRLFWINCAVLSRSVVSDSWDPMDYNLPGSSVDGISQAWLLEWVAVLFSRGSFQPKYWTCISCISGIAGRFFTHWATEEAFGSTG